MPDAGDNEPLTPPILTVRVFPSLASEAEEIVKLAEACVGIACEKTPTTINRKQRIVQAYFPYLLWLVRRFSACNAYARFR